MRIRNSTLSLIAFIFSMSLVHANTCDLANVKYTKEAYELVDRDYIDKMLRSTGYHKEVDVALKTYVEFYGQYPQIIDNKTGLPSNRRFAGMAPDGKWLIVEPNGTVTWMYEPLTGYSLSRKSTPPGKAQADVRAFKDSEKIYIKNSDGSISEGKYIYDADGKLIVKSSTRGLQSLEPKYILSDKEFKANPEYAKVLKKPKGFKVGKVIALQPAVGLSKKKDEPKK